jgi:hypothetical protein
MMSLTPRTPPVWSTFQRVYWEMVLQLVLFQHVPQVCMGLQAPFLAW